MKELFAGLTCLMLLPFGHALSETLPAQAEASVGGTPANAMEHRIAGYAFDTAPEGGKIVNAVTRKADALNKSSYPRCKGAVWHDLQGGVMEFSGVDHIVLPKILAGRNIFSVTAWLNAAPGSGTKMIATGGRGYGLELTDWRGRRRLRWAQLVDGKWTVPIFSDGGVSDDTWHHVAVTADGSNVVMYVNGERQQTTAAFTGKLGPKLGEFIGTYTPGSGDEWEGCLDDVFFFDVALTQDRVRDVMKANPKPAGLFPRPASSKPLEPAAPPVPVTWLTVDGVDSLKLVQAYADVLIARGRDVYGAQQTPLFSAALDRRTYAFSVFRSIPGIRSNDRILTGANPMVDENLYQILYALTQITGDAKYAKEADAALQFFFQHCQSPVTGLMAWGEHLGWDMETESVAGTGLHEFARPWVLWDRCFKLAPEACAKFAKGLSDHQLYDDKTTFSRHAAWAKHGPGTMNEYPRHGGFYIATWAKAYQQTKDRVYLQAIDAVVTMFEANRSKTTHAIAASTIPGGGINPVMWPASNLSLAIDLTHAASVVPEPLRTRMLSMADEIDRVHLLLKHDFGDPKTGFVETADVNTLEPISANNNHNAPYSRTWVMGYGSMTDAGHANLCYQRYRDLPDGSAKQAYRTLILASAERYLTTDPDMKGAVYPGAFGHAIWHMLCAYQLTGEARFSGRAEQLAQLAAKTFITDGCPLPRASSVNAHYEAITGGDTLMMSILWLSQFKANPKASLNLVFTDR